jgi:signal transduction histidine kinase
VTDNGIGIDPRYADKIFLIFQRLHARGTYDGTGIGLAICKKIVEYHGGTLRLDDGYSGGARFVFTLPKPATAVVPEQAGEREPVVPA